MPDASAEIDRDGVVARHASMLADVVRDAGRLALAMFGTELRTWTKGASSPVSEADIAVNELIRQRLDRATPDYGWLSEESADDSSRLGKRRVWVVDPIDGTRSYIAGRGDWCISAALVEDGAPIIAAVFAPVSHEFFFATRDIESSCNDAPIRTVSGTGLIPERIAGPKPLLERIVTLVDGAVFHPRIGSLALRLCRVGQGRIDAAFAGGSSKDWDLAGADLIVRQAGGRMTTLAGETLVYNSPEVTHGLLVAAGRDRHARIVTHFRDRPLS